MPGPPFLAARYGAPEAPPPPPPIKSLVVLDAARFPTREAVRIFVASVEFEALSLACQATLESYDGLGHLPERLRAMVLAADFVLQDLTLLT